MVHVGAFHCRIKKDENTIEALGSYVVILFIQREKMDQNQVFDVLIISVLNT